VDWVSQAVGTKSVIDVESIYKKAVLAYEHRELDESIRLANEILSLDADHFLTLNLLGALFCLKNELDKALLYIEKSLLINPKDINTLNNQGVILAKLGRNEEALVVCNKTIELQPGHIDKLNNKGNILKNLNRPEEALAFYEKVLFESPNNVDTLASYGCTLVDLGRYEEALESYDKSLLIDPENYNCLHNKSYYLLLVGKLKEGFELYENRWGIKSVKFKQRKLKKPLWLGNQNISGKRLFVHLEQGLGDMIQMYRYVNELDKLDIQVILEVNKSLKKLFSDNAKNAYVVCEGDVFSEDDFDYHCPIMSLPLAFKTDLDSIISPSSYIKASANLVEEWRGKLPKKTKPFIGIVWAGSSTIKARTITFSQFSSLFRDDCQFVSLQKEVPSSDYEDLKKNNQVLHFGDQLRDFSDTAALLECMDLVISIDTSVAHLAGSMGKTTWALIINSPDWRWLLERDDSPWYSSVKLFRQSLRNHWDDVLLKIQAELVSFVDSINSSKVVKENYLDIRVTYEKAVVAYQDKKLDVSIQLADEVLTLDPDNYLALNLIGSNLCLKNELDKALLYIEKSLLINPKDINTLNNQGVILAELGRYEEALVICNKTIELQPGHTDKLNNKGNILKSLNRLEEALAIYEKILFVTPNDANTLASYGSTLVDLGRYEEALESYDKSLLIDPENYNCLHNKSYYLLLVGNQNISGNMKI
jgi:tetratricopeptide (TPR) repeat protein